MAVGGDWDHKEKTEKTIALTKNGGQSWYIPKSRNPIGFASDVAFLPNSKNGLIAVSTTQFSYSKNMGKSWVEISELRPYTLEMVSKNKGWVAGKEFISSFEFKP